MYIKSSFAGITCLLLSLLTSAQQSELFVAPGGKGVGTSKSPVGSLSAALARVKAQPHKQVVITVRAGDYALDSTLVIDNAALSGHTLIVRNYRGEKVTVHGLRLLKASWKRGSNGIYSTSIAPALKIDQLFANRLLLRMARYPNYDSTQRVFGGTAGDALSPERVRKWKDPTGAFVHALHEGEWGGFHYQVTAVNPDGTLALQGGWQNNRPAPMHAVHRFVENVHEELDAPDEWYYDSREGRLDVKPANGADPARMRFEYSVLDELLVIRGSEKDPVASVVVDGIEFSGTNRTFMKTREPILRTDWTIYRGGAVLIEGTENVEIRNCSFNDLGGNAIFVSNYNRNTGITGNYIRNIGASAILFMGSPDAVRSPSFQYNEFVPYSGMDMKPGPSSNNYPADAHVSDNLVHDIGRIEKQVAGIVIDMAARISASHNTIYNVPRSGINIGDGCWGGHVIEYNDVFNTVLETGDHGAFNSWGRDRFWLPSGQRVDSMVSIHPDLPFLDVIEPITLRYNRFQCSHGWDIDLDDGSSNYRIYGNLCLEGGLKLREGYRRVVYNNVLVNNSFHPHVWFANSMDEFKHNIVSADYAPIGINDWGPSIDSNLFLQASSLASAHQQGTDLHSISGDPAFRDPARNDFTVTNKGLIKKIEFRNIPIQEYGVVSARLKRIAQRPTATGIRIYSLSVAGATTEFMGATVKNIEGLGERSASGLPDEDGILVLKVPEESLAGTSGLQPRDVIRSVNGKSVKDMVELVAAIQVVNWQGQAELGIIRNQVEKKLTLRLK